MANSLLQGAGHHFTYSAWQIITITIILQIADFHNCTRFQLKLNVLCLLYKLFGSSSSGQSIIFVLQFLFYCYSFLKMLYNCLWTLITSSHTKGKGKGKGKRVSSSNQQFVNSNNSVFL